MMLTKNASKTCTATRQACPRHLSVASPIARPQARPCLRVNAASQPPVKQPENDMLLRWSASVGLPTGEGLFGFRPFAEQWCGRLAMMGFIISIVEEFITGRGTLAQMYLMEPGQPNFLILGVLCAVFGGATLFASADTLNKIRNKELTDRDIARYKNFLALNKEGAAVRATEQAMKATGDFTTPGNNMTQIKESKAEGAPVDAFLSTNEVAEGNAAASQMKTEAAAAQEPFLSPQGPAISVTKRQEIEDTLMFSFDAEKDYAMAVERSNGRWAMMGFLSAVLVEAATGKGIIMQCIMWLKLTGFLGADSGF